MNGIYRGYNTYSNVQRLVPLCSYSKHRMNNISHNNSSSLYKPLYKKSYSNRTTVSDYVPIKIMDL